MDPLDEVYGFTRVCEEGWKSTRDMISFMNIYPRITGHGVVAKDTVDLLLKLPSNHNLEVKFYFDGVKGLTHAG